MHRGRNLPDKDPLGVEEDQDCGRSVKDLAHKGNDVLHLRVWSLCEARAQAPHVLHSLLRRGKVGLKESAVASYSFVSRKITLLDRNTTQETTLAGPRHI